MQLIHKDHFDRGIKKYKGVRDSFVESLLSKGNLSAEVYAFNDGRYLVKYSIINQAFLYESKEELMEVVDLS